MPEVNARLYKPIGVILLTIAVVNLMFLLYPIADALMVFRYCVGYWLFVFLVVIAIFGVIPIGAYSAYAIYWLRRQKLKKQASQMMAPSAPCAPDVIAKKVGIAVGVIFLILLSLMSIILTAIVAAYHGNSVSIRRASQLSIVFKNITITRDENLVPHIESTKLDDVAFAQAIAHCQDRLYQMDYLKRMAYGRLATLAGESAVQSDIFFRTLNFNESANAALANLDSTTRSFLESYALGVNRYVEALRPTQKPFEYQVHLKDEFSGSFWSAETSLVILKMFQFIMSGSLESELMRFYLATNQKLNVTRVLDLVPMARYDAPTTFDVYDLNVPDQLIRSRVTAELQKFQDDLANAEKLQKKFGVDAQEPSDSVPAKSSKNPETGSSWLSDLVGMVRKWEPSFSWIKAGRFIVENNFGTMSWMSFSGGALKFDSTLLASSFGYPIHHQAPNLLYLNHLRHVDQGNFPTEGNGLSLPGVPGLLSGRTLLYSWSATPMQADIMDLYVLRDANTSEAEPSTYEYMGDTKEYDMRQEVIHVKGGKSITITVRDSVHGPVISDTWERFTQQHERPNSVSGMRLALRWTGFEKQDTTMAWMVQNWRYTDYTPFETGAYAIKVPAMNVFYTDRTPFGGYIATGLVPIRGQGHTGLFPVDGSDTSFDWKGFQPIEDINPNVDYGLLFNAGNKVVPPGFSFDLGYEFEESWRFELLRKQVQNYVGASREPKSAFAQTTLNSKSSGLLYALIPALKETQTYIASKSITLTSGSGANKHINQLLSWSGEMTASSNTEFMFGWYEELAKLGQWESKLVKWHRPQFIVNTLAPHQNTSIDLQNYGYSGVSDDLLERNKERCKKSLVLVYGFTEDKVNNAEFPCHEFVAVSLERASSKSLASVNKIKFTHPLMSKTTYGCVCNRSIKKTGGGTCSVNNVLPHFQMYSSWSSVDSKYRIPLSNDGNQWGKKRYDKFLPDVKSSENSFFVPVYMSGSSYKTIETMKFTA